MARVDNITCFEDTMELIRDDVELLKRVGYSIHAQKYINEAKLLETPIDYYDEEATIVVSSKRTFEAAKAYKGMKTCVLNFANAFMPGGGVTWGASAQEESLCRCSTLYPCLADASMYELFYKPHNETMTHLGTNDIIYSEDIIVLKEDTALPTRLKPNDRYSLNVITCAAPDLRNGTCTDEELYNIHFNRLKRILNVAANEHNEVIILGAFGCGAFANDPRVVSKAMHEACREYMHKFKAIEFAIYCKEYECANYDIFNAEFENK